MQCQVGRIVLAIHPRMFNVQIRHLEVRVDIQTLLYVCSAKIRTPLLDGSDIQSWLGCTLKTFSNHQLYYHSELLLS